MAASILTLLFTAFLPILGWKFSWITPHWIAGVVLTFLVLIHIVRALFWQSVRSMAVTFQDLRDAAAAVAFVIRRKGAVPKPGKYLLLQKLYHLGVAVFVLALIGTGALMLLKIDTPFWRRSPYWFADTTWGWIYFVHGISAMVMITLVMIHVYFAFRPEKRWMTLSMLRGWITREDYRANHDPARWAAED